MMLFCVNLENPSKGGLMLKKIVLISFLFMLVVIMNIISCENKQKERTNSGENSTVVQNQSMEPREPKETSSKYGLNWGNFSQHPAKKKIENSFLINELSVLVLHHGLLRKPFEVSEFASYFPEYQNAPNEFEKRKVAPSIIQKLNESYKALITIPLCLKIDDLMIGEYDFRRKGFPISVDYGLTEKEMTSYIDFLIEAEKVSMGIFKEPRKTLKSHVVFADHSNSAECMSYVILNNIKDRNIFPSFIPLNERTAEKIVGEFSYKGNRIFSVYVVFVPKTAKTVYDICEGADFERKEVYGIATYIIFATKKGTVFGVYPKFQ
jgi:hypothetical protein